MTLYEVSLSNGYTVCQYRARGLDFTTTSYCYLSALLLREGGGAGNFALGTQLNRMPQSDKVPEISLKQQCLKYKFLSYVMQCRIICNKEQYIVKHCFSCFTIVLYHRIETIEMPAVLGFSYDIGVTVICHQNVDGMVPASALMRGIHPLIIFKIVDV